ncbi:MAG: SDR family NAD(P)-dependent oxidoreductase [Mucilaginibacter polytrichastri]|nr:SDR family NAD(P)-dependent oxidoreductase [Mucilaginibacter polytrichastri]
MALTALITGATAGIGEACAEVLAREGYNLILTGRRADRLERLGRSLEEKFGVKTALLNFDVRERGAVEEQLNALDSAWKHIDVLVNNAGLSQSLDPLQEGNPDDWDTMIDTNIKGLLYVSRVVSAWMAERGSGHIINLGSIAGKEVYPNGNVYCATKHAVDALNKAMRVDLLQKGIRITAVHPGAVETEFSIVRFKGDEEKARKVYAGFTPLNAMDVAETVWFVISRPPHVNINEITVMPTAQASATQFNRNSI